MCHHDTSRAIALEHGAAHDHDHARWTRRDFLMRSGLAAVGGAALVGATPVRAMARTPLVEALRQADTDRVLVLVQLQGGNDGLNTIIPLGNDLYHNARPTLGVKAQDAISVGGDRGFHASMAPLRDLWDDGSLAVVQGVGYAEQDLSHFRGTDIWLTADPEDASATKGWAGQVLAEQFPDIDTSPPSAPPAVQMGTSAPLLFEGDATGYGMAMLDIDVFLRLADGGDPYPTDTLPATAAGDQLGFVRRIANDAFRYRDAIEAATAVGKNDVEYPDADLGEELAAVALLIKGRLGSRIYLVKLGGFDTHADQANKHAELLAELSGALAAFFDDLGVTGDADRTLAMTFSEFGRRVEENGSRGTDHGTSAPLFLAGPAAQGGFWGDDPDLSVLDRTGNLAHGVDFRQLYASVIQDWFGLDAAVAASVLGGTYDPLPVVARFNVSSGLAPVADTVRLDPPRPNPVRGRGRISFTLAQAGPTTVDVFDVRGRAVARLADGVRAAGPHAVEFDASGLPAGTYLVRLTASGTSRTVRATVVR